LAVRVDELLSLVKIARVEFWKHGFAKIVPGFDGRLADEIDSGRLRLPLYRAGEDRSEKQIFLINYFTCRSS
jgi:hypothetical protein